MRWRLGAGLSCLLVAMLAGGGCLAHVECEGAALEAPADTGVSVLVLAYGRGRLMQGTATSIGGRLYLTAGHVVDPAALDERGAGWRGPRVSVLARGDPGEGIDNDWALIDMPAPREAPGWRVCLDEPLRVGDEVVVIGFRARGAGGRGGFEKVIRHGRVRRLPWWVVTPRAEHVAYMCLDGPTYNGMSGGPVLRHTEEGWELVGIHVATYRLGTRFLWGAAQLVDTPSLRSALEAQGVISDSR